mmetsp:Transcript_17647/g.49661  ORF Transcript_17647/g.49661 Transcript_17647/m.49661 type:complete len:168 (+) Transcript_17647:85-588(+)
MQQMRRQMYSFSSGRPPVPPFTQESAIRKVRMAEDGWNTRNAEKVVLAYTGDCAWRNRSVFLRGHEEIVRFLLNKWSIETEYRLIKELFCYNGDRIAVRYVYEWFHVKQNQWIRSHGNENWVFNDDGYMKERHSSINDVLIEPEDRFFHWPLGPRPEDHPGLSDLGL